jgi:hypothetical protein
MMKVLYKKSFYFVLLMMFLLSSGANRNLSGKKITNEEYDIRKIIEKKISTYSFSDIKGDKIEVRKKITTKVLESLRQEPF